MITLCLLLLHILMVVLSYSKLPLLHSYHTYMYDNYFINVIINIEIAILDNQDNLVAS